MRGKGAAPSVPRGPSLAVPMSLRSSALCLTLCLAPLPAAQEPARPKLAAGDPAPALRCGPFLRGEAFEQFPPGRITVLEFWATWCGPCVGAFPHLSELQAEYRERGLTILGVDVWEEKGPIERAEAEVRAFVEKRAAQLAYSVALDRGDDAMARDWLEAAGLRGIPATFVVDGGGKIAWIGHPDALALVLQELYAGTWDVKAGPARIEAAHAAVLAACERYAESLAAGESAWKEISARYPSYAARFLDRRYAEMLANGHTEAGYALGREMLARAKARHDSIAAMDVITPMMELAPGSIDRALALDVAEVVYALGDPTDPGRHISLVQIHYFLGNLEEAGKHRELALQLSPPEVHERMNAWFERLEEQALAAGK